LDESRVYDLIYNHTGNVVDWKEANRQARSRTTLCICYSNSYNMDDELLI